MGFKSAKQGMEELKKQECDIIIADHRLPGTDGLEFLEQIKDSQLEALTILITA